MKRRTHLTGEHYTYRLLWAGGEMFEDREVSFGDGSWFLLLGAILLYYLALEGFLNFIGPKVCPKEWKNEHEFFSTGDYRGTLGKLDLLLETLGVKLDKGARPYQTARNLHSARSTAVHPRTEVIDRHLEYDGPMDIDTTPDFVRSVDKDFVTRARKDVEDICDRIHAAARDLLGDRAIHGFGAFQGVNSESSAWVGKEHE